MKTSMSMLMLILFLSTVSYSQIVSNVPMEEINVEYIHINPSPKANSKFLVNLDFGQVNEPFNQKDMLIKDENGNQMEFNSLAHILNFMDTYNYELVNTYAAGSDGNLDSRFIMRKKKSLN